MEKLIDWRAWHAKFFFKLTLVIHMDAVNTVSVAGQNTSFHGPRACLQGAVEIAPHVSISFGGAQRHIRVASLLTIGILDPVAVSSATMGIDQAAGGGAVADRDTALKALGVGLVEGMEEVRIALML